MAKVHPLPARSTPIFPGLPYCSRSLARMSNYVLAASNARLCANCCRQLVPRRKQRETHEPLGLHDRPCLRAAMAIALPAAVRACCRRWWLHDLRLVGDDNQVSCPRKNRRDSPSQEPKPDNDPIAAKLPRKRFIHPAFTGMRAPEPARQPRRLLRSTPANGYSLRILKPGSAPACLTATR